MRSTTGDSGCYVMSGRRRERPGSDVTEPEKTRQSLSEDAALRAIVEGVARQTLRTLLETELLGQGPPQGAAGS